MSSAPWSKLLCDKLGIDEGSDHWHVVVRHHQTLFQSFVYDIDKYSQICGEYYTDADGNIDTEKMLWQLHDIIERLYQEVDDYGMGD